VITRRGQDSALRSRFAALGVDAPGHPVLACGRGFDLVWAGPQQWLAMSGDRAMPAHLAVELEGLASVSDQSDGRAVVRLSGPKLRETLAKGCAIDLHPRAFRPGHTAITAIAHIGVQLWQHDEEPTFDLLVARSMAGSFWGWLSASAAEFGLALR
jgi:sarcosine oxidase subunit gamma